jgi:glutamine cyclotransferase
MMHNRMSVICIVVLAAIFGINTLGSAAVIAESNAARRPNPHNPPRDTGTVVFQFTAPFNNVDGMTWDGEYIWLGCDGLDRIWKMDTMGNILDSIPAPNTTATGLCWDGQYLWCADGGTITIYKLDPITGAVLASIPGPGSGASCEGLAWMNDTLWNTNWAQTFIWSLDPNTGVIYNTLNAPGTGSTGLTWDWHDNALWNSDQLTDFIYKLDPVTGAIITQFACPDAEVQDLAFDGTYLWTCGWTSGIVYKMDIGYTGIEEKPIGGNVQTVGFATSMANPVRGSSPIAYNTAAPGRVSIVIYNSTGRLVKTLVNGVQPAGAKTVFWNGMDDNQRAVANGIYFLKLDAEGQAVTHKLILLK